MMSGKEKSNDFPTPKSLQEANKKYAKEGRSLPVDEEGKLLPFPASRSKASHIDSVDFTATDKLATEIPHSYHKATMAVLVKFLCSKASTELERVRAIWRWIAAQDISKLQHEHLPDTVLENLLKIAEAVDNYSQLFVDMCRTAGLQAEVVRGIKKYDDFNPRTPPAGQQSWSAVVIDGQWWLCDSRWSSGYFTYGYEGLELVDTNIKRSKAAPTGQWRMRLNETYFLTPPEQLIYTHFPMENDDFQLLARSVSFEEFCKMAKLGVGFFDIGAELLSHKQYEINADGGLEDILLGLPQKKKKKKFSFQLWKQSSGSEKDIKMGRYVFMSHKKGQKLSTKITIPQPGKYKFMLMVESESKNEHFYPVCEYLIACDSTESQKTVEPLPENPRMEWGPGADMESIGLDPVSHKEAIIETTDGIAGVDFKSDCPVEVRPELYSNGQSIKDLENYLVQQEDGQNVNIMLKVPKPEQYALQLYAKKKESADQEFTNVCCYLVEGDPTIIEPVPFPKVVAGKIGATDDGKKCGIRCCSHPSSFIKTPESGNLDVRMETSNNIALEGLLKSTNTNVDANRFLFLYNEDNQTRLSMKFPVVGSYSLHVNSAQERSNLQNMVIEVNDADVNAIPFPQMYPDYARYKITLLKPTLGILPPRETVEFSLKIPGAQKAAIKIGAKWIQLKEDEGGVWSGEAKTGSAGSHVVLLCGAKADSDAYSFLLRFDVLSQGEYDAALASQKKKPMSKREEKVKQERRKHDIESTRKILREAVENDNQKALIRVLHYINERHYTESLQPLVDEATKLVELLDRT